MKIKTILTGLGALMASVFITPAHATECGTDDKITIAEMTWLSASTLAHIADKVLRDGYGCKTEIVPGDTVPTATSMYTKSSPHIAPELWVSTAESIWLKALKKGNVYKAGDIFESGGEEGLWVPAYVMEQNPGLKSITDLKAHAQVFAEISNPDVGRIYGGPPGWGSEIIINNLYTALGLEDDYELFSPGSGANLKAAFARKARQGKPIVGYYWSPTDVVGKYDLRLLETPAFEADKFTCLTDKNCQDPAVTGWKKGEVAVAVVQKLRDQAPNVAEFLSKFQFPNATVNKILAWGDDNSASPEELALHFFKTEEAIWIKWVPADVAARIKASI